MPLIAIRPSTDGCLRDDAEVVDQSRYGWEFLDQTIALWRLVDTERADAIAAVRDRASASDEVASRFDRDDLRELVRRIGNVEEVIVEAGIVDAAWRVEPSRLHELAARVPGMDLTTERTLESKTHALGEVMINAVSLRNFLEDALGAGCVVVHG